MRPDVSLSVSDPSEYLGRSPGLASTTFVVTAHHGQVRKFQAPVYARTSLLALQGAQDAYGLLSNTDGEELRWEVDPR